MDMIRTILLYGGGFLLLFFKACVVTFLKEQRDVKRKRKEVAKKEALDTKRYLEGKPWRRLEEWNRSDETRERLSSSEIQQLFHQTCVELLEPELCTYGFSKAKKKKYTYRKIAEGIVYEIRILPIRNGQRGLRQLKGCLYPLCLIHESLTDEDEKNYRGVINKKQEYQIPFYFDCATKEHLLASIQDMREWIQKELLPFFARYPDLLSIETMYVRSYQKQDVLSLQGYRYPLCNAAFYIGEGEYEKAKRELSAFLTYCDAYRTRNQKRLTLLGSEKDSDSQADFYRMHLRMHEIYITAASSLLVLLEKEEQREAWQKEHRQKALFHIEDKNFTLLYI